MTDDRSGALADELAAGDFADPRLARRLGIMVCRVAANPALSFPRVFSSSELEAAYRFFNNGSVTPDTILSGHFDATRERCGREKLVLVVHDSTTCAFRVDGKREGLGRVMTSGQAFFAHASLALTADGARRPLGVVGLRTWTRGGRDGSELENEMERWRLGVDVAAKNLEGAALLHVMDREGDDYGVLAHLVGGHHRFVVRSKVNRLLVAGAVDAPRKLDDVVARIDCEVGRTAPLAKRVDGKRSPVQKKIHPSRSARVAKLAIGAARVTLQRPTTLSGAMPESLALNVVRVWEPKPPPNEPAVEWVLLTSESIETPADLERIVDAYRARWTIEEYFKALKTGCAYESRQLGDYDALVNALAFFAPIACHLLALRNEARRAPDAPATAVVSSDHIDVLRALGRRKLPDAPTVRDVLLAVAALGGHIAYAGEPGWLTLTRGYEQLITLTRGWLAAKIQWDCDQR
jgi:hypothetical protein